MRGCARGASPVGAHGVAHGGGVRSAHETVLARADGVVTAAAPALDGFASESVRACVRCLIAFLATGVISVHDEPAVHRAALAALAAHVPDKLAHAMLPLATIQLVHAVGDIGAAGARGADAAARVRELGAALAARIARAREPSLLQALCHAFARLGVALAQQALLDGAGSARDTANGCGASAPLSVRDGARGAPTPAGAELNLGQLSAHAGSRLFALLVALPPLVHAAGADGDAASTGETPAALCVLRVWCTLVPLLSGQSQRKLSALVLVGMLSTCGLQLQSVAITAPPRTPTAGAGCTRALARERRERARTQGARGDGGDGASRSVTLSVLILEAVLQLLRDEFDAHDAAHAARTTPQPRAHGAARGASGGDGDGRAVGEAARLGEGRAAEGGASDGRRGAMHGDGGGSDDEDEGQSTDGDADDDGDGDGDGDGGEEEEYEGEEGSMSLSAMLHADSTFEAVYDALGADDEVVERHSPAERALCDMSLGPFLSAFLHSLARSAPEQLRAHVGALCDEDRQTVQRALEREAW